MTSLSTRHPVAIAYAGVSVLAAIVQHLGGRLSPALLVVLVALTALAWVNHPHRWTTLLILVHVRLVASGSPGHGIPAQAALVVLAACLGALHLLAPWLAWRSYRLTVDRRTLTVAARPLAAMTAFALAAALLTSGR